MNFYDILTIGTKYLKKSQIKNPHLDAELILSKILNKKREEILIYKKDKLLN